MRSSAYGLNLLVAGTSGSGKSTITTGILERLAEQGYQFAVIDPEGDYSELEGAVVLGRPAAGADRREALDLLDTPHANAVVNLVGIPIEHRPDVLRRPVAPAEELRRAPAGRTGS